MFSNFQQSYACPSLKQVAILNDLPKENQVGMYWAINCKHWRVNLENICTFCYFCCAIIRTRYKIHSNMTTYALVLSMRASYGRRRLCVISASSYVERQALCLSCVVRNTLLVCVRAFPRDMASPVVSCYSYLSLYPTPVWNLFLPVVTPVFAGFPLKSLVHARFSWYSPIRSLANSLTQSLARILDQLCPSPFFPLFLSFDRLFLYLLFLIPHFFFVALFLFGIAFYYFSQALYHSQIAGRSPFSLVGSRRPGQRNDWLSSGSPLLFFLRSRVSWVASSQLRELALDPWQKPRRSKRRGAVCCDTCLGSCVDCRSQPAPAATASFERPQQRFVPHASIKPLYHYRCKLLTTLSSVCWFLPWLQA